MGLTFVKVKIINPADLTKLEEAELLAGTGAIYTMVPKEKLKRVGMKPHARRGFKLADGWIMERRVGNVMVECLGEQTGAIAIFGEPDDTPVLGVQALEGLGLEVDQVTKGLRPTTLPMV